jgi:hypothetical protein
MKFAELLKNFCMDNRKCFINGVPDEDGGRILAIEEDYIVFEIKDEATKNNPATREEIVIPIDKITSLSKGEEKVIAGIPTKA